MPAVSSLADVFAAERVSLVRLCAYLSGDYDAAEDLAQETLVIAWQIRERLSDSSGAPAWLAAIARNVCRRWIERQRREPIVSVGREVGATEPPTGDLWNCLPEASPLPAVRLEHNELTWLLDQALARLPQPTRAALVLHEVEGLPQAEVAARLQLTETAVAVRLHRGRLLLRRLLQTDLREDARACGVLPPEAAAGWHETALWCPACGQQRLRGRLDHDRGAFAVQCPHCCAEPELFICRHDDNPTLFRGLTSVRVAYNRAMRWGHQHFRTALARTADGSTACWWCGGPVTVRLRLPVDDPDIAPSQRGGRGVYVRCLRCRECASTTPRALLLHLPEGRHFWRANPRIRQIPERELTVAGQPAVSSGFERVDGGARLEIICHRDTYAVLAIDGVSTQPQDASDDES
jgi:RNA polymerase sigma-70 factor (ECF subfamily)